MQGEENDSDSEVSASGQWAQQEVTPEGTESETSSGDLSDSSPARPAPPPVTVKMAKKQAAQQQRKGTLKPKKLFGSPQKRKINGDDRQASKVITKREKLLVQQRKKLAIQEGTWVQCTNSQCNKWRHLAEIHEPCSLPVKWQCNMNKADPEHDSCDKPEDDYKNLDFYYLKHAIGCLVWAKLHGFPWWPAMIDDDPDTRDFFWTNGFSEIPTHYHVVFLDFNVTRAWVSSSSLRTYRGKFHQDLQNVRKDLKFKLAEAIRRADQALPLTIPERLKKFSFASCFKGEWPKTSESSSESESGTPGQSPKRRPETILVPNPKKPKEADTQKSVMSKKAEATKNSHHASSADSEAKTKKIFHVKTKKDSQHKLKAVTDVKGKDEVTEKDKQDKENEVNESKQSNKASSTVSMKSSDELFSSLKPDSGDEKSQTKYLSSVSDSKVQLVEKPRPAKCSTDPSSGKSVMSDLDFTIESVIRNALANFETSSEEILLSAPSKGKKITRDKIDSGNKTKMPVVKKSVKQLSDKGKPSTFKKNESKLPVEKNLVNKENKKKKPVFTVKKKADANAQEKIKKLVQYATDSITGKRTTSSQEIKPMSFSQKNTIPPDEVHNSHQIKFIPLSQLSNSAFESKPSSQKTDTKYSGDVRSSQEIQFLPASQMTSSHNNSTLTQDDPSDFEELSQLVLDKLSPPSSQLSNHFEMEE